MVFFFRQKGKFDEWSNSSTEEGKRFNATKLHALPDWQGKSFVKLIVHVKSNIAIFEEVGDFFMTFLQICKFRCTTSRRVWSNAVSGLPLLHKSLLGFFRYFSCYKYFPSFIIRESHIKIHQFTLTKRFIEFQSDSIDLFEWFTWKHKWYLQ